MPDSKQSLQNNDQWLVQQSRSAFIMESLSSTSATIHSQAGQEDIGRALLDGHDPNKYEDGRVSNEYLLITEKPPQ